MRNPCWVDPDGRFAETIVDFIYNWVSYEKDKAKDHNRTQPPNIFYDTVTAVTSTIQKEEIINSFLKENTYANATLTAGGGGVATISTDGKNIDLGGGMSIGAGISATVTVGVKIPIPENSLPTIAAGGSTSIPGTIGVIGGDIGVSNKYFQIGITVGVGIGTNEMHVMVIDTINNTKPHSEYICNTK